MFLKYQVDIYVHISNLNFITIKEQQIENIKQKISRTIEIQKQRFAKETFSFNAHIPLERVYEFCTLDSSETKKLLDDIASFSNHDYEKKLILKIARTIADLEENIKINKNHILQAIETRKLLTLYEEPTLKKTLFLEEKHKPK